MVYNVIYVCFSINHTYGTSQILMWILPNGYVFSFLSKTPFPKNFLPPDENLYWVGPLKLSVNCYFVTLNKNLSVIK